MNDAFAPLLNDCELEQLTAEIATVAEKSARYILDTADFKRTDRLYPAHYQVFTTNPLSVAHGACGPTLFLLSSGILKELPAEIIAWLLKQPIDVERYPPGLYFGLAGIAYTFQEAGLSDRAEEVMAVLRQSPLLYQEPGMLTGAAGWGFAHLYMFERTGNQVYLDWAVRAGEHLLRTAQHDSETCYWQCNQDGRVHFGFGNGASGIALFLMYLHERSGVADFLTTAIRGLEFDLSKKVETELGWQWKGFSDDTALRPYWMSGSAGIGSTVIRFYQVLGIERYQVIARRIAEDTFVKYTVNPSQFEGLAGIAEFMLDMFHFTGDDAYRRKALDMADTILWFKIDKGDGVAWPGRWLDRISNDYALGGAGIGLFLTRLLRGHGRHFVDLSGQSMIIPGMSDRHAGTHRIS
jgi:hypothetical protein